MAYIEFEQTDDPEILRMQLDIAREIHKQNKEERKVAYVLFWIIIAALIVCGVLFELAMVCGVYGGILCALF